jgi:hypothetical protein
MDKSKKPVVLTEAALSSEMMVNSYKMHGLTFQRSNLHSRRHENPKSHTFNLPELVNNMCFVDGRNRFCDVAGAVVPMLS